MDAFGNGNDRSLVFMQGEDTQRQAASTEQSADYWRAKAEEKEASERRALTDLENSQQALRTILVEENRRATQGAQMTQAEQADEDVNQRWNNYLESLAGGGSPVQRDNSGDDQRQRQAASSAPSALTAEQVAAIADNVTRQRIEQRVSSIEQDNEMGRQLAHRFQFGEDRDLLPYSDIVAGLFQSNVGAHGKVKAYQIATATVRDMAKAGRLASPGGQAANGVVPPTPSGGQAWRTSAHDAVGDGKMVRIDSSLRQDTLEKWTAQRREEFLRKQNAWNSSRK